MKNILRFCVVLGILTTANSAHSQSAASIVTPITSAEIVRSVSESISQTARDAVATKTKAENLAASKKLGNPPKTKEPTRNR